MEYNRIKKIENRLDDLEDGVIAVTELELGTDGAGGTLKHAAISLGAAQLGGVETNTSFTSPAGGMILQHAWIEVTDAEAGTVDVGTQGTSDDPDGFLDGVSLATLGYVGQVPAAKGALLGCFIPAADPISVTSSGDLNSCAATLHLVYLELPA